MTELSSRQVAAATVAFLMAMRREFIARHGAEEECRVPNWTSMSPADRAVLVRAMRAALAASMSEDALSRFSENAKESHSEQEAL